MHICMCTPAGNVPSALLLNDPGHMEQHASLFSGVFPSNVYIIKTTTQLEVKVLFNKYNFHKLFKTTSTDQAVQ